MSRRLKELEEKAAKNWLVINCQKQINRTYNTKDMLQDKPYTSNGTERDVQYITELIERVDSLEVARRNQAKDVKSKECMLHYLDELADNNEIELTKLRNQVDVLIQTIGMLQKVM